MLRGILTSSSGIAVDYGHVYFADNKLSKVFVLRCTGVLMDYDGTGSNNFGSDNGAATISSHL